MHLDDAVARPQLMRVLHAMSAESGEQFFASIVKTLPELQGDLPYARARFRLDLFSPELFEQHGIDCPQHIGNSVLRRQAEFIAGRMCARSILDAYGHGKHIVTVGKHREPVWPEGFIGSITHSAHYAAAIVCPGKHFAGIGIDIETIFKDDTRQAMMDLVVGADEADYLRAHPGAVGFDCLLTLVFSAKETFFKAAFPQVKAYFDFDAVKVFDIDLERRLIRFRCVQNLSEHLVRGQVHHSHFDFVGGDAIFTAMLLRREHDSGNDGARCQL